MSLEADSLSVTAPADATPWHVLSAAAVAQRLRVSTDTGLTTAEAAALLGRTGPNLLRQREQRTARSMLLRQFSDFMILVLIAAAALSAVIGDAQDTVAIGVIILLNAVIGFVQEMRAERALLALRRMAAARATVLRDGARIAIEAADLVPGDVVLLEAGNLVPADLRVYESVQLRADESALTGESAAVAKTVEAIDDPETVVADRTNIAFRGTSIVHGRGLGVVVATGMATEIGRVAALLESDRDRRTPLQRRLEIFGHRVAIIVVALCVIIFAAGIMRGEPLGLMGLTAVSLAVAAIPEALPAVVTILLALGARRMAQERALVRRLPAVETLGSVTHICADKTGTLTLNRMVMEAAYAGGELCSDWPRLATTEPWRELLHACVLNNDAQAGTEVVGDPTEVALLEAAARAGISKSALDECLPRVSEIPFSAERKRMTTFQVVEAGNFIAYTKGAPEAVLPRCETALGAVGVESFPAQQVMQEAAALAGCGLRVLAVASRYWARLPDAMDGEIVEQQLCFLGLVGLLDPPRPEALDAVTQCQAAGIVPVMITGDHPDTARAIAQRLGIIAADGRVISGRELAGCDDASLQTLVDSCRVYARVDPAQKIRLVEALQARGYCVAMTGDGINDAPALMRADIGVAMGKGGTDVAREASSLVLLDDNFATIVSAVREGRRIYDNIRKFVRYAMTGNSAEILTIFLAPLVGLPIPLLPIHILWVNLVTDGLPGLALAAEPAEAGTMQRPPRSPRESLFAHGVWQHVIWVGLLIAGLCLTVQAWAYQGGSSHGQTMVFTVLTLSQMGHILAIRGERVSLFKQGIFTNMPLLGAVLLTFALQLVLIYVPVCNTVFGTQRLTGTELAICVAAALVPFLAVEAEKRWVQLG